MTESKNTQMITLLVLAIIGRAVLKLFPLPSVEPIIPLAVLAGITLGMDAGIIVGAGGFFLSNFLVPGGQGFWTIWQAMGAGLAGLLPAITGQTKKIEEISSEYYLGMTLAGIFLFEILINIQYGDFLVFPFSAIHLISGAIISYFIYLIAKK
ncbi:MAG: hypothetical protein Q7S92_05980 [Candidatus Diapherotrites archaeon]|nr:hypothetical protein [Candidatus Diapherotrites archaeon]